MNSRSATACRPARAAAARGGRPAAGCGASAVEHAAERVVVGGADRHDGPLDDRRLGPLGRDEPIEDPTGVVPLAVREPLVLRVHADAGDAQEDPAGDRRAGETRRSSRCSAPARRAATGRGGIPLRSPIRWRSRGAKWCSLWSRCAIGTLRSAPMTSRAFTSGTKHARSCPRTTSGSARGRCSPTPRCRHRRSGAAWRSRRVATGGRRQSRRRAWASNEPVHHGG